MTKKTKPYMEWIREQLKVVNCKVHKWVEWNPDDGEYVAYIDSRRVVIPKPVDDWSFLVALHEIGHVSTGHRLYSYLMEYNTERWAIKRAKEAYGVECPEYVEDAKNYVRSKLLAEVRLYDLKLNKIKPYVLEWLNETQESISIAASEAEVAYL